MYRQFSEPVLFSFRKPGMAGDTCRHVGGGVVASLIPVHLIGDAGG